MGKKELPDRESNPGLPRDRRRYSPLYYRGIGIGSAADLLPAVTSAWHENAFAKSRDWPGSWQKVKILRAGFEPATYGCLMFDQLQSTALPTELSKGCAGEGITLSGDLVWRPDPV